SVSTVRFWGPGAVRGLVLQKNACQFGKELFPVAPSQLCHGLAAIISAIKKAILMRIGNRIIKSFEWMLQKPSARRASHDCVMLTGHRQAENACACHSSRYSVRS